MKTIIIALGFAVILTIIGCNTPSCEGTHTYTKIDQRLTGYVFKPGSYWVYFDSINGIMDSQYVYAYSYRLHYRNPIDTPNPYFPPSTNKATSGIYCGPYYLDDLSMGLVSYLNGVTKDTMSISGFGTEYLSLKYFVPHFGYAPLLAFQLSTPDTGLIGKSYDKSYLPTGDTAAYWYRGIESTVAGVGTTFTNVHVFGIELTDPLSTKYRYPTDLYFALGYGIVKIVEHRPTGDVPWTLTNYHIVN